MYSQLSIALDNSITSKYVDKLKSGILGALTSNLGVDRAILSIVNNPIMDHVAFLSFLAAISSKVISNMNFTSLSGANNLKDLLLSNLTVIGQILSYDPVTTATIALKCVSVPIVAGAASWWFTPWGAASVAAITLAACLSDAIIEIGRAHV